MRVDTLKKLYTVDREGARGVCAATYDRDHITEYFYRMKGLIVN